MREGTSYADLAAGTSSSPAFERQMQLNMTEPRRRTLQSKLSDKAVSKQVLHASGKMLFEDVIKESIYNEESLGDRMDINTKSIQAASKQSLWEKDGFIPQSLVHLQVTDEADTEEKDHSKINVEAWE